MKDYPKYTATMNGCVPYGHGLYTLFSARDKGFALDCLIKDWDSKSMQVVWNPVHVIWVGIRATDRGASYIIKTSDGINHHGITYFKMAGGKSLKQYLKLTSREV